VIARAGAVSSHVIVLGDVQGGLASRFTGWVVRDSFALLLPGPQVLVAWVVRRSLDDTLVEVALRHGVGLLNIDECRVGTAGGTKRSAQIPYPKTVDGKQDRTAWARTGHGEMPIDAGRWPPNLLFVHDTCSSGCTARCPVNMLYAMSERPSAGYYPTFPTFGHAVEWLSRLVGVPD
jgi:hypothetical protein